MAKKRKAVKKARKTARPAAKSKAHKPAAGHTAHKPADEGFFAAFLKLFAPPETKGKKA